MRFKKYQGIMAALWLTAHSLNTAYALTVEQSKELDSLIFRLNNLQLSNAEMRRSLDALESGIPKNIEVPQGKELWKEVEARLALINEAHSAWGQLASEYEGNDLSTSIRKSFDNQAVKNFMKIKYDLDEVSTLAGKFAEVYDDLYSVRTTANGGTVTPEKPTSMEDMAISLAQTLAEQNPWEGWEPPCRPNCWN